MPMINPSHPFYKPVWRRALLVVVAFGWAGVEWHFDNPIWAYLAAAIGGYLAWHLFITWPPEEKK